MTGKALRRLRLRAGLKQHELADLMGVTEAAISRWESGDRPIRASVENHVRLLVDTGAFQPPPREG